MHRAVCWAILLFATNLVAQTVQQCSGNSPLSVDGGAYGVENNKFNHDAARQPECIQIDTATTNFSISKSSIDVATDGAPGGYPFIYQGCHWGACSDNSALPLQVGNIASATGSWSTTQPNRAPSSDAWDAAYDIWFNHDSYTTARPDGAELMIWLNHHGPPQPEGTQVDTTTINGINYEVWYDAQASPPYIAYVMTQPTDTVKNLDLLAIINDAAFNRRYLDPSLYLISVEAGFELWNGGAGLATNSFFFSATPGTNPGGSSFGSMLSSAPLHIWWPTDGSVLSGIHPFKARLEDVPLSQYRMFWSVDADQLNPMENNSSGDGHKEAEVDLSNWTWRDAGDSYGPFSVTFIAKDTSGATVQTKTIMIYRAK